MIQNVGLRIYPKDKTKFKKKGLLHHHFVGRWVIFFLRYIIVERLSSFVEMIPILFLNGITYYAIATIDFDSDSLIDFQPLVGH